MDDFTYKVGDRVKYTPKTHSGTSGFKSYDGMVGTITFLFDPEEDIEFLGRVKFEHDPWPELVYEDEVDIVNAH